MLGGKRAFVVLSALAFAACFLVSEYGRAKQLHWLMGWPPLLFVFTVPPEYRWRFTSHSWAREVFTAMTLITCTGLAIGAVIETLVIRSRFVAPRESPIGASLRACRADPCRCAGRPAIRRPLALQRLGTLQRVLSPGRRGRSRPRTEEGE